MHEQLLGNNCVAKGDEGFQLNTLDMEQKNKDYDNEHESMSIVHPHPYFPVKRSI